MSRRSISRIIAAAVTAPALAGCRSGSVTHAEGTGTEVTHAAAVTTMKSDRAIAPENVSPQATVRAWIAALARGDSETAWSLLTQATK